ncbi:MAG: hypothetical protein M3Q07_06325 [Pseudobdellovibrionaceae bacterium]|nr:hypothetical protein [Pseudobdellovibrionaceae bacterium]
MLSLVPALSLAITHGPTGLKAAFTAKKPSVANIRQKRIILFVVMTLILGATILVRSLIETDRKARLRSGSICTRCT